MKSQECYYNVNDDEQIKTNIQIVQLLIGEAGRQDSNNKTALMSAAYRQNFEAVKILT